MKKKKHNKPVSRMTLDRDRMKWIVYLIIIVAIVVLILMLIFSASFNENFPKYYF